MPGDAVEVLGPVSSGEAAPSGMCGSGSLDSGVDVLSGASQGRRQRLAVKRGRRAGSFPVLWLDL